MSIEIPKKSRDHEIAIESFVEEAVAMGVDPKEAQLKVENSRIGALADAENLPTGSVTELISDKDRAIRAANIGKGLARTIFGPLYNRQ